LRGDERTITDRLGRLAKALSAVHRQGRVGKTTIASTVAVALAERRATRVVGLHRSGVELE
jgi:hypothetical protein